MGDPELTCMQTLAQEVWRRNPTLVASDATLGSLTWTWAISYATSRQEWAHHTWSVGRGMAAWGWVFPAEMVRISEDRMELSAPSLVWQVHPDHPELVDEVLDWFEIEVGGARRRTAVRTSDTGAVERLSARGYLPDHAGPWSMLNTRSLDDLESPVVPSGYRLTTMRSVADVGHRVAVHRAAWEPSSVTEESYGDVMSTWPYRSDLDFVVEAPDGSLAASAIAWMDDANRVAEFEPVGTDPRHRRLGLSRAVLLFGMHQLREAGASQAAVGCRGDDNYPVPRRVYSSVGFRELSRDIGYTAAQTPT